MIRNHGRGVVLALGATAVLVASVACGNPQRKLESGPIGAVASAATIDVQNVLVEPPKEGESSHPLGSSVIVRFSLYNRADVPDELRRVETATATQAELHRDMDCDGTAEPASRIPVEANGTVPEPPGSAPGGGGYHLELIGLDEEVKEGTTVPLVFTFKEAGRVTVDALVLTGGEAGLPPLGCERA